MSDGAVDNYLHRPVMLQEALKYLDLAPGKIVVDATLGGGGHAKAILGKILPQGKLIGIDWDEDALKAASTKLAVFGDSFQAVKASFSQLEEILFQLGIPEVNAILFDLGVSSFQLDSKERGFSYQQDVFLDMRMNKDLPRTAADLLQELSPGQLAKIFRQYGGERWAWRIAQFIDRYRRSHGPIIRSGQLVDIIKDAIPAAARRKGGHPARRVFQALRIAVNRELDNLKEGLEEGLKSLAPGGRLVVISYHSLEDMLAKKFFLTHSRGCACPPELPQCKCGRKPGLKILTRKPLFPAEKEVVANPRARSARLRAAEKI